MLADVVKLTNNNPLLAHVDGVWMGRIKINPLIQTYLRTTKVLCLSSEGNCWSNLD